MTRKCDACLSGIVRARQVVHRRVVEEIGDALTLGSELVESGLFPILPYQVGQDLAAVGDGLHIVFVHVR